MRFRLTITLMAFLMTLLAGSPVTAQEDAEPQVFPPDVVDFKIRTSKGQAGVCRTATHR